MDSKEIDYQLGLDNGNVDKKDNTKVFKVLLIIAGLIIIALLVTTIVLGVKYSSLKESSSKESSSNESSSPKSNDNYFTSKVFMVKPVCFGFNNETAETNPFQQEGFEKEAQENALKESGDFAKLLTEMILLLFKQKIQLSQKLQIQYFQIIGFLLMKMELWYYIQCMQKIEELKENRYF